MNLGLEKTFPFLNRGRREKLSTNKANIIGLARNRSRSSNRDKGSIEKEESMRMKDLSQMNPWEKRDQYEMEILFEEGLNKIHLEKVIEYLLQC